MKRKSKITCIIEIALNSAAGCMLSAEYKVFYSSGVTRRFYLQHLTPEMNKFLVNSHDNNNVRVLEVSKADIIGRYTTIKAYYKEMT